MVDDWDYNHDDDDDDDDDDKEEDEEEENNGDNSDYSMSDDEKGEEPDGDRDEVNWTREQRVAAAIRTANNNTTYTSYTDSIPALNPPLPPALVLPSPPPLRRQSATIRHAEIQRSFADINIEQNNSPLPLIRNTPIRGNPPLVRDNIALMVHPHPEACLPDNPSDIDLLVHYNLITYHRGFDGISRHSVLQCQNEHEANNIADQIHQSLLHQFELGLNTHHTITRRTFCTNTPFFRIQFSVMPERSYPNSSSYINVLSIMSENPNNFMNQELIFAEVVTIGGKHICPCVECGFDDCGCCSREALTDRYNTSLALQLMVQSARQAQRQNTTDQQLALHFGLGPH